MTSAEAKTLEQLGARLAEDWECVQILVSRTEPDGTGRYFFGVGNWFARQGMAHDFIGSEEARVNANEISKALDQE